jgi:F0F1-type ATP synthase membrane subunit b/b'
VNAERDAKAEEARIDERAVEAAKRLAETSIRQIQDETSRAKQVLRKEAVELAVELAQSILEKQVQAGDQRRLAQEFLTAVRSEEVTHG